MRDMQAQSLDNRLALIQIGYVVLVFVLGKETFLFNEPCDLFIRFPDVFGSISFEPVFEISSDLVVRDCLYGLIIYNGPYGRGFRILIKHRNDIVNDIVNNMDTAACNIHYDIISVVFVLMDQCISRPNVIRRKKPFKELFSK